MDHKPAFHPGCRGAEGRSLGSRTGLGFAAPRHPYFAPVHHALEPPALLLFGPHAFQKNQGIGVALPAAGQGKIGLGNFLGQEPEGQDIALVRSKSQSAVLGRRRAGQQSGMKQVGKVLGGKGGLAIIGVGARGKLAARQFPHRAGQIFLPLVEVKREGGR